MSAVVQVSVARMLTMATVTINSAPMYCVS